MAMRAGEAHQQAVDRQVMQALARQPVIAERPAGEHGDGEPRAGLGAVGDVEHHVGDGVAEEEEHVIVHEAVGDEAGRVDPERLMGDLQRGGGGEHQPFRQARDEARDDVEHGQHVDEPQHAGRLDDVPDIELHELDRVRRAGRRCRSAAG